MTPDEKYVLSKIKVSDKLRNFLITMKGAHRRQIVGELFVVDDETDEICGCALGQGLLDAGVITEEEIQEEAKNTKPLNIYDMDGNIFKGRIPYEAKDRGYRWLKENFGERFPGYIWNQNDIDRKSISTIARNAFNRFFGDGK
jgi:hypothetical protein